MDATASISNGENGIEVPSSATRIELPAERAAFFFIRAKRLYQLGGRYSAVLERIVTTTLKVPLFPRASSISIMSLDASNLFRPFAITT